jgi:hypothetical protein
MLAATGRFMGRECLVAASAAPCLGAFAFSASPARVSTELQLSPALDFRPSTLDIFSLNHQLSTLNLLAFPLYFLQ